MVPSHLNYLSDQAILVVNIHDESISTSLPRLQLIIITGTINSVFKSKILVGLILATWLQFANILSHQYFATYGTYHLCNTLLTNFLWKLPTLLERWYAVCLIFIYIENNPLVGTVEVQYVVTSICQGNHLKNIVLAAKHWHSYPCQLIYCVMHSLYNILFCL